VLSEKEDGNRPSKKEKSRGRERKTGDVALMPGTTSLQSSGGEKNRPAPKGVPEKEKRKKKKESFGFAEGKSPSWGPEKVGLARRKGDWGGGKSCCPGREWELISGKGLIAGGFVKGEGNEATLPF